MLGHCRSIRISVLCRRLALLWAIQTLICYTQLSSPFGVQPIYVAWWVVTVASVTDINVELVWRSFMT